ncbi:MAG: hypothetical protein K0R02_500 [Rickettsiaceae bacterium]|jgi:hypothetical protein|nr:hypothetical protein [Rickettsiaceae bacterium]
MLYEKKGIMLEKQFTLKVASLEQARKELLSLEGKDVILINSSSSIHYLGIKVVHHIFNVLRSEFKIKDTIIDVEDDHAAAISALKLGYTKIIYRGNSTEIKNLLGYIV